MRADEAIKKLQEIVAIDPDADLEFEVKHQAFGRGIDRETFHEATITPSEQDSEEDRYHARKRGHPIMRAVFEVTE